MPVAKSRRLIVLNYVEKSVQLVGVCSDEMEVEKEVKKVVYVLMGRGEEKVGEVDV